MGYDGIEKIDHRVEKNIVKQYSKEEFWKLLKSIGAIKFTTFHISGPSNITTEGWAYVTDKSIVLDIELQSDYLTLLVYNKRKKKWYEFWR